MAAEAATKAAPGLLPRISIVVPSFNQGAFIDAALGSLVEQGYPDLEILVADGGSRDGTTEIIERYGSHITWWRSAPDRGQGHALNEGFEQATGEVMGWLCSDDVLMPEALLTVGRAFASTAADLVTGRCQVINEAGIHVHWERLRWADEKDMLLAGLTLSQPATFWRRTLWDAAGAIDEAWDFVMDFDLWLRCFQHHPRVEYLDRILALERRHAAQKTAVHNLDHLRREKIAARLRAAGLRGYSRTGFALRSVWYRRTFPIGRSWRVFRGSTLDARWYGGALGFERGNGALDYLRLSRRWLAAICYCDADERGMLRALLGGP